LDSFDADGSRNAARAQRNGPDQAADGENVVRSFEVLLGVFRGERVGRDYANAEISRAA
jgi:hypothetical protein